MIDTTARVARSKQRLKQEGGKRTSLNLGATDVQRVKTIVECIEARTETQAILYAIAFTARRLTRTKRRTSTQSV